jgi:hypothetical protein
MMTDTAVLVEHIPLHLPAVLVAAVLVVPAV